MNPDIGLSPMSGGSSKVSTPQPVSEKGDNDDGTKQTESFPEKQPAPRKDSGFLLQRRPTLSSRPSSTVSTVQIERMVSRDKIETETYGVSELREGFFDAFFLRSTSFSPEQLQERFQASLPDDWDETSPLKPTFLNWNQWRRLRNVSIDVMTTRAGIRVLKAFMAFFIAYILCLVPAIHNWLGRYSYIMTVSTILNHPARAVGAQIDGVVLTSLGIGAGLGWGALGLLLSISTPATQSGFGGILALFLALFMIAIAWTRSFFLRFFQGVVCSGVAISFMLLAETESRSIPWSKVRSFGVSWMLGQAIALIVNCLFFPDAGARALSITFQEFFRVTKDALDIPRPRDPVRQRHLAQSYIDLSQAYRDIRLDITITKFHPDDVEDLRNIMQAVIRALMSMDTETYLLEKDLQANDTGVSVNVEETAEKSSSNPESSSTHNHADPEDVSLVVLRTLSPRLHGVLEDIREGLQRCNAALMGLSGYRKHLGPPADMSADVSPIQHRLRNTMADLNDAEAVLFKSEKLTFRTMQSSDIVQLFLFVRHVGDAAEATQKLMKKVDEMRQSSDKLRFNLPSYPFSKAIHHTNRQVRHDRGGITASSYHTSFAQISELLDKIKSKEFTPRTRPNSFTSEAGEQQPSRTSADTRPESRGAKSKEEYVSYKIWRVLHHLQGLEGRYALKVCIVTSLLSIPSYLKTGWWDLYDLWWVVAASWIMIHPRVGGNIQDLLARSMCAILGAVWSLAAYTAGRGSPYIMAVFAAIYMIPMLHRYIQSAHQRSGVIGCLSFAVVSLSLYNRPDTIPATTYTLYKGLAFFIGTAVPILINWFLWPFVARHELRFALSSMIFFMSVIYRSVVARYVYFQEGKAPTPEEIEKSEMLEGRIREGFLRIRQLLQLTRHEIRLRAPFEPLPYIALIDACERFFDYLITLRQAALSYKPDYIRDNSAAASKLLGYRRDAVAAILANLYILAGALRSQRKVPKYLPSAAAARKKLMLRSAEIEEELAAQLEKSGSRKTKWSDIHSFSYRESLTGCVDQLEELEKFTKLIVGEQGFDDDLLEELSRDMNE